MFFVPLSFSKKKIFVLILIGLFFIIITAVFLLTRRQINIDNDSKEYTLKYTPTKTFTSTLNNWSVWKQKNIFVIDGNGNSINSVNITLTDTPQKFISQRYGNNQLLWSADVERQVDDSFDILVYLSPGLKTIPEFANNKDRAWDKFVTLAVLDLIYTNTHDFLTIESDDLKYKNIRIHFMQNPEDLPFEVAPVK